MKTIKVIVIFLNIVMALLFLLFTRGLSFDNEKEHTAFIGFIFMILLFSVNSVMIWY